MRLVSQTAHGLWAPHVTYPPSGPSCYLSLALEDKELADLLLLVDVILLQQLLV